MCVKRFRIEKKREEEQEKIRFRGVNVVSVYRKDITAGFSQQ